MDEFVKGVIQGVINLAVAGKSCFDKIIDRLNELKGYAIAVGHAQAEQTRTLTIEYDDGDTDFKAAKKEDVKKMPPEYKDGTLRQRKNGLWEYRFVLEHADGTKEKKTVYGRSVQICYGKRTEYISGKIKHKTAKDRTVGEWFGEWFKRYRRAKSSEKYGRQLESYVREIIAALGAETLIKRVTAEALQDFLNNYNSNGNTRGKIAGLVKGAFGKARALGYIKLNPCDAIEIARHRSRHYPAIQLAEQRLIFEKERSEIYRKLFMVYCCSGLRLTELFGALPHIDFKNKIFYVVDEDTKTKKHRREIPFLPGLITPSDRDAFAQLAPSSAQTHFKRLFKRLGIKASPQSFRVTFISCLNHIGMNPKKIQELVAHSTIEMTMNVYAKLLKNDGTSPILKYLKRLKAHLENT